MSDVGDFGARITKKFAGVTVGHGSTCSKLRKKRFSSGALELDLALGGGFPRGRFVLVYGPQSAGKTTLITKACASVQQYCRNCKDHETLCECGKFEKGRGLVVDSEGAFDITWAETMGFDRDQHMVLQPEYGEQAIDVISTAINEGVFDLIVLDSIAMTAPSKEIEASAEDQQIGLGAKMFNKAWRRWQAEMISQAANAPCFMAINQMREKSGFVMGDTMTLPHGKGQQYVSSIELRLKTGKVHGETGGSSSAYINIAGSTAKNKTYTPKLEFSFNFALNDYSVYEAGDVANIESIIKYGRQLKLITVSKGDWVIECVKELKDWETVTFKAKGKDALEELLAEHKDVEVFLYNKILEMKL